MVRDQNSYFMFGISPVRISTGTLDVLEELPFVFAQAVQENSGLIKYDVNIVSQHVQLVIHNNPGVSRSREFC
jgi:hypothetical protein